jgi:GT2 family glycosyltransferase
MFQLRTACLFLQKSMSLFPSVAIVILNYNGRNYLEKFLPSVLLSTYANKQIIVADNASTDDSIQFLQQQYPSIQILINTENLGFAGGYNWALKQVTADYYVLLNSDVEVTPNWIEPIVDLMQKNITIAACQPKILCYNQKENFEYAGAAGGWIDALGYPFSRGRVFDVCEKDTHQYDEVEKIFWATGAAMFVRSTTFHEANGFDEFFFAHMEEIDLCWRMQLAGYSIYAVPSSIVYHVGGGTLPKGFRKTFLNFRNNLIMLSKNLPLAEKLWKLPLRFVLDWITAFKSLFDGDIAMFKAIIKAQFAVIAWWFSNKKSAKNPSSKSLKHLAGVYNQSVVWQYFIRNKKTFREIVNNKL